ncbi:MAG: folylpolyglutamate synthase/dihydrofolate synthase family protein [Pseudomonadota bacterium]
MANLHDLLRQTSLLHDKSVDLGLERCLTLLQKLGNPHLYIPPVIHVAGTNGKGSTLAFIKQILEDNGYSVHRYTSPHLVRFNERIELHGKQINDDLLADALTEILNINDGASITTFELITCLAFMLFSRYPADFVLLETGMGGRLDATNVIQSPLITGITSISLDHQAELGETLTAIAFEKAGIIKQGIPVVVPCDLDAAACKIIEDVAAAREAPFVPVSERAATQVGLHGEHQRMNAAVAVKMIEQAGIVCTNLAASLQKVFWAGRLQCLTLPTSTLWLDGAHNEAGAIALIRSLRQINTAPWTFFIHIKARKDARAMLKHFAAIADSFYFIDFPVDGGEGIPMAELFAIASELGVRSIALSTMNAFTRVITTQNEPLIATGSLFWIGKILGSDL